MKKLLCVFLFLGGVFPVVGYAQKYYSKAEIAKDLDYLYLHLDGIHPDMYRVISEEKFAKEMHEVIESLEDSMTVLDFYKHAASVVSLIEDGHTSVYFPYNEFYALDPWIFPANIRIDSDDLSVRVRSSRYAQLRDAEILSINGRSAGSIVGELLGYVSGETMGLKTVQASNMFQFMFPYIDSSAVYDVVYAVGGETYREKFDAFKFDRVPADQKIKATTKSDPRNNFSFAKVDQATVLFKMRGFDRREGYYQHFIDSMFRFIRKEKIEDLIIDIRGNPGGDDEVATDIFKYICPKRFQFTSKAVFFGTELTDKYELEWSDEGRRRRIEVKIRKTSPHLFKRFRGNVYVLTDSGSASMSVPFAHAVQYYGVGKVVGEATGGCISSFGDVKRFRFPNTGLVFGVAFKEFYPAGGDRVWRSVVPDIEVPATQALDRVIEEKIY